LLLDFVEKLLFSPSHLELKLSLVFLTFAGRVFALPLHRHQVVVVRKVVAGRRQVVVVHAIRLVRAESDGAAIRRVTWRSCSGSVFSCGTSIFTEN